MASIGGMTVTAIQGRLNRAKRIVTRADSLVGVDGNVVIRSAWRSTEDRIRSSVTVSGGAAGARVTRTRYRALAGQVVTVIDQFSEVWSVTVLDVEVEYSVTFTAGVYRVVALWTMLTATDRPV